MEVREDDAVSYTHLDVYKRQAEDNKDIQMAKRYVEQWKKVKAENLGLLLWGDVGTGKSFVAACIATVSYTHLDVYKRQAWRMLRSMWIASLL